MTAAARHCEAPTGPREVRPDDKLRAEAIQAFGVPPDMIRISKTLN